jgi:hypothetical protein
LISGSAVCGTILQLRPHIEFAKHYNFISFIYLIIFFVIFVSIFVVNIGKYECGIGREPGLGNICEIG